jgi:alanyl-tRNA synthetase
MDIKKTFLDYFEKNEHLILPSASLIPTDDPSVLLTTAGMQQFKPYYLGIKKPPKPRIATVQKCFRTSDIDRVGYTDQHLTFFEMLGNFAFADYFKKEAIGYAMDFMVNVLHFPIKKLSVGVFAGDSEIPADIEAIELWEKHGIPSERIYKFDRCENFWGPAGDTGPCGPCTEIYYDFGEQYSCGKDGCNPNCDCDRYLEIWNLVFTQYNFNGSKYVELPNKNIDTGMGLERVAAVLEGNPSVFKTSLFKEIVNKIEEISGKKLIDKLSQKTIKYKSSITYNEETNRCIKIIADHSRAISFLISDGVVPSNEGRGYILRRILRRAIRFGKLLGINDYFLNEISPVVIRKYSEFYPEFSDKKDFIFNIIRDEEKRFSQTLKEGIKVLIQNIETIKKEGKKFLQPEDAFKLYDTFGFPVELTTEILIENNLGLNLDQFNDYLKAHSEKSKVKTAFDKKIDKKIDFYKGLSKQFEVEFLGYQENKINTKILSIIKTGKNGYYENLQSLNEGEEGEIILKSTPFYGEKGGQISDRGMIKSENGVFVVDDCKIPVEGIFTHKGKLSKGKLSEGDEVYAEVDAIFRKNISKNHTSTHILHWALRTIYGKDVTQAGSFVGDERFRFDYNIHITPILENIERIEKIINEKIQKDDIVRCFETTREYADEIGAISLFEEKYGKFVRVVEIDNYSRELCGGIHVSRTGEIGLLKIISDSSIGANVRRIEAVTGMYAFNYLTESSKNLKEISSILEVDELAVKEKLDSIRINSKRLEDDLNQLQIKAAKKEILSSLKFDKKTDKVKIIDFNFSSADYNYNLDIKSISIIGDELINMFESIGIFVILGNVINDKPVLIIQASKDLIQSGIDCSELAKDAGKILKGGGGGKKEFAQVGGSDMKSLSEAMSFTKKKVLEILGR